jgi:hypothetical protein
MASSRHQQRSELTFTTQYKVVRWVRRCRLISRERKHKVNIYIFKYSCMSFDSCDLHARVLVCTFECQRFFPPWKHNGQAVLVCLTLRRFAPASAIVAGQLCSFSTNARLQRKLQKSKEQRHILFELRTKKCKHAVLAFEATRMTA